MGKTPEDDSHDGDAADKPLDPGELVLHRPDGDDSRVAAWLEGEEEEEPDEEDGYDADGQRDEEPDAPPGLWSHVLQGDEVLGRGDRGGGAAHVGGEGDAEEEGFGHVAVGGEVAEDRLDKLCQWGILTSCR